MDTIAPVEIDREEVRQMGLAGAPIIEVLSKKEYQRAHLAGAFHIPLAEINRSSIESFDPGNPVIVYCYDYQ